MEHDQNTTEKPKIRVAIFEDDDLTRDDLSRLLKREPDFEFVGSESQADGIVQFLAEKKPEVILMDISMPPGIDGIEAARRAREADPKVNIVILTSLTDDEKVFEALKSGAIAYLLKGSDKPRILDSIRSAAAGGSPMNEFMARKIANFFAGQNTIRGEDPNAEYDLSSREIEVLKCLCEGMSNRMVGESLFIAPDTVRSHLRNVYEKLQVKSKTQAVLLAMRKKLIS